MAVTLSPELAGLLATTGHRWPDADEDQLVTMADGWRGLRDRLVAVQPDNRRAVQEIVAGNQSQAVAAAGEQGNEIDRSLQTLIEICARVEAILIAVARAVFDVKKAIVDALAAVAKTIADWKRDTNEIPIVGGLISGAIENFIEEPLAALTRTITSILDRFANFFLETIIQRLVALVRVVKGIVAGLRKVIKLDVFGDWPTNPSGPPHPERKPGGNPKVPGPNETDPANLRALDLENAAAVTLAQAGYDITQLAERGNKNAPNPDYLLEGRLWEAVTPSTPRARNVWTYIRDRKLGRQANRFIINIDDEGAQTSVEELRSQFQENDLPGLEQVKVIAPGGAIIDIYP